jgi:hypothetical protein
MSVATHTFKFADLERAFQVMETEEDAIIKPLMLS